MAKDHFKTHYYQKDRVDWNFNILFEDQPDVSRMAEEYKPGLSHPGLYEPISSKWLHATILRVGLVDDFTEEEMRQVANQLAPKLAELNLPELVLDSGWLLFGNVILHISPDDEVTRVYDCVIESMESVLGESRTLNPSYGKFIPHVTLAYTKDNHQEAEINQLLSNNPVVPAKFRAIKLSLIKQWPTEGHYEWEVVQEIPIGQNN